MAEFDLRDKNTLPAKDYFLKRKTALQLERQSFIPHWRELSEFIRPRKGRFFTQDRNKGDKRYQSIINSKATWSLRVAVAGMLAGTMSPTRPWFNFETYDPELMERPDVKMWLYKVEQIIRQIFNDSNLYGQASSFISELLLFGTGAISHVDYFDTVARFFTHTAGSYYIGQDDNYNVDTFCREIELSVKQIVQWFGLENCSEAVKDAYDKGNYEAWYPVVQLIEPNNLYDPNKKWSINKKFRSVYYEPGLEGKALDNEKLLSVKGFDEFPVHTTRWDVTGEDVYGTDCPAMGALGDIKALQIEEKRKAQAIDKMINPVLTGPAAFRNVPITNLPGGVVLADITDGQGLTPVHKVDPRLTELREDMNSIEKRIEQAFFVDLFLAISTMEGIQPRNQLDLIQRNEERLLQLGPVLERFHGEFLDPLMDRTFNQAVRASILPPPPDDLSGQELKVRYISTLAMAQRAVATQSIDRVGAFVGTLVSYGFENVLEKFDAEQAVDEYAKAVGVPPSVIVPDEVLQERRAAQAERQQLAEANELANQAADTAKKLGDTNTQDKNALTDLVGDNE